LSKLTTTRQHVILAHKQELLAALGAQRLAQDAINAAAAGNGKGGESRALRCDKHVMTRRNHNGLDRDRPD
jgi:hypothetical protein